MIEPWQRGYSLARLRGIAGTFKARHAPLVFGRFGVVLERDIAEALATNALIWKGDPSAPRAAAIAHRLKAAGSATDFAQRDIVMPANHVKVSAFAALDMEAGALVLASLSDRAPGALWVEIFEEDAVARRAVECLPELRYRATRIAAGSEVKGIYTSAPPGAERELHPAEQAALCELQADFAGAQERAEILAEVERFARFEQHYSSYNKRQSWTAYSLRGFDRDPRFIIKPAEMAKSWKAANPQRLAAKADWTSACEHFPTTLACVRRMLGGRQPERVRLMQLAPGGELSRHADVVNRDAGLADGMLARLHLPLRTSEAVIFHGWDKRGRHFETAFREGALCYLDQRGPHRVENRDPERARIHIVVDMESDEALRGSIAAALAREEEHGHRQAQRPTAAADRAA
jgi:hypothetical protein